MDSAYITLDPEFEAILAEVAAQPDSALLRVKRPQRIRALFERERVSESTSFLSRAERHLLAAYRWETVALLRDVCRLKLVDGSRRRSSVRPYDSAWRPNADAARETIRRERDATPQFEALVPAWELLMKCVADPVADEPTVSELAEVSLRLEPTDEARIQGALDLVERGAPRTAARIYWDVLALAPEDRIQLIAWNNLGMAHSFAGNTSEAHTCHVRACSIDERRIEPWIYRFLFGIQLGLFPDVREASRTIDALTGAGDDSLSIFVMSVIRDRRNGVWSPSDVSRTTISKLGSDLGPAARRIASVFE